MCWRDNVRDYRAENARRELNHARIERNARGKDWALKATPAQKKAAQIVSLVYPLLQILAFDDRKENTSMLFGNDWHNHFPVFAKTIGLRGKFYVLRDGLCPAVSCHDSMNGLFDPKDPYATISCVTPIFDRKERKELINSCINSARELGLTLSEKTLLEGAKRFLDDYDQNHKKQTAAI